MAYAVPIAFALFLWWFSTGAVLCLGRRSETTFIRVLVIKSAIALMALVGLTAVSHITTPTAAYLSFLCGLLIWGWHEMSFLFGHVTGPRRTACPNDLTGYRRFRAAFETVSHHEFAILVTGVALVGLTWGAENQVGTWTFLILWVARISAKLNIFLGAPNLTDDMLPLRLDYLKTYFRRDRVNAFFPISVTLGSILLGFMIHLAVTSDDPFQMTGVTLISSLLALALLEHWFLVLPIPDSALWRWAVPAAKTTALEDQTLAGTEMSRSSKPDDKESEIFRNRFSPLKGPGPNVAGRRPDMSEDLTMTAIAKQTN